METKMKTNQVVSVDTKSLSKKVPNEMKYSFGVDESTIGWPVKKFVIKYEN